MSILSSQSKKPIDILWSEPLGKMNIEQVEGSTKILLEFYFSLPIVELLQNDIESFSFAILPSDPKWGYSYFDGDIASIEKNIESFFNSQLVVNKKLNSEYHGYFYSEYSLLNFISDEKITELSRFNSKNQISSFGEIKKKKSNLKAEEVITNKGNYLSVGNVTEPFIDANKNIQISDQNDFKEYFKDVAGSYSISPMQIGNVEFIRNKINCSFSGKNSFEENSRIKLNDKKFPNSFWSLWKKMFKFDAFKSENLSTTKIFQSKYFPCKVVAEINFPKGTASEQALMGLFIKDLLKIEIKLNQKEKSSHYETYYKDFKVMDMLKQMSRSIKDPVIKISNMEFSDRLYAYNPNDFSLTCIHLPCYWNESTERIEYGSRISMTIPPKKEVYLDIESTSINPSRYYETIAINGFYIDFLGESLDGFRIPVNQIPWKTIPSKVPGIAGKISKNLSDPKIGYYRLNNNTLKIRICNVPPYVDQLKFYIKSINSVSAGAKRAPGTKRLDYIFITSKPEIGNKNIVPETEISYLELVPGNYQILCDLYKNGSLIDTIDSIFTKDPSTQASNYGIDFNLDILNTSNDLNSEILITEASINTSNDLLNDLIERGTLPEPISKTFSETWASSKKLSRYILERFNFENCETESLGVISAEQPFLAKATELTTKNHVYTARQFVATIGQLVSSNAPIRISNAGRDYVIDYAKFKSQKYLNFQTLPQVDYSVSDKGVNSWPIKALGQSTSGRIKTKKISKSSNIIPIISGESLVFDPIKKVNILSWKVEWSGDLFESELISYPLYWLITANYGGVTSPISYQVALSKDLNIISVVDSTLGGALGTVNYKINCVYPDGSMVQNLGEQSITIDDDKNIKITLGRGL